MNMESKEIIYQPIPEDKIAQVKRLARDIAWFFINEELENVHWREYFMELNANEFLEYLTKVWQGNYPNIAILEALGYVEYGGSIYGESILSYSVTSKAVALLEEPLPSKIFISYSRTESSALALLVLARLKEHGLSAFLDMNPKRESFALAIGDEWYATLEKEIAKHDTFIILIGQHTLNSPYVRQEIEWARKYNKAIFPVWHNKFKGKFRKNVSYEVTEAIKYVVGTVNATIVEAENPKQYNAALDELLSSFGIVP